MRKRNRDRDVCKKERMFFTDVKRLRMYVLGQEIGKLHDENVPKNKKKETDISDLGTGDTQEV